MNSSPRIRNMALGLLGLPKEYKIKYYSPYDQVNSIKEETRWAPQLTLEFPDMDTLDIVLFEVFRMGGSFKSMPTDTTNSKELLTRTPLEEKKVDVKVYPNPNEGSFEVYIEQIAKVKHIQLTDKMGKVVHEKLVAGELTAFNNLNLSVGVYFVHVVFEDKTITRKVFIR